MVGHAVRLVAYLQAVEGGCGPVAPLTDFLVERLPAYMVPSAYIWVNEIPVTSSGKVDRHALPRQAAAPQLPDETPKQPASELERAVAEMVAEVLGLETVGVDENFILLGGHSLLVAQLVVRIADRFGVEIAMRSVFERPTVVEIAAEVEQLLVAELSGLSDEEATRLINLSNDG
jgi:acyl carrier protein